MSQTPLTNAEKAAKMDEAVEEFMRIKKDFPEIAMSEVARDHGVNLNTMRARVRKASGLVLTRPEEDRLRGYAIGLYDSGGARTKKALLEYAHIIQMDKECPAKLVDRAWVQGFLGRYPEVQLRGCAKADNIAFVQSYAEFCNLWEDIAQTSLEYEILEPSQFWYFNETSFYADYEGDLATFKRYEDNAMEDLESGESPITVLMAYSAAGDLIKPVLLFEEDEKPILPSSSTKRVKLASTDDGLLDAVGALKWLERFEVASKQYIKPEQWRYLFMDGTIALTLEFVEYAVEHKILYVLYVISPASTNIFDGYLKPRQFYETFESKWKAAFEDPDVCVDAFQSAGIFPVDMTKNEKVMAYKTVQQDIETSRAADVTLESLGKHSTPTPQQVKSLLDERLSRVTQDADSLTTKTDYFLLEQTRSLLLEETAKVNELSRGIGSREDEKGDTQEGQAFAKCQGSETKVERSTSSNAYPRAALGERKRPAAQPQPWGNAKRPRVIVPASSIW